MNSKLKLEVKFKVEYAFKCEFGFVFEFEFVLGHIRMLSEVLRTFSIIFTTRHPPQKPSVFKTRHLPRNSSVFTTRHRPQNPSHPALSFLTAKCKVSSLFAATHASMLANKSVRRCFRCVRCFDLILFRFLRTERN